MPTPTTLATHDSLDLQLREWSLEDARGTVLMVHGLGEHIGRYAHVATQLMRCGRRVVGYDRRGHGASGGARGGLNHADDLLHDLAGVIDTVRERHPGPLVLLGHSLGGLVAARMVSGGLEVPQPAWHRRVDALVLSSPALDPGMSRAQKRLLAVLGLLAPSFVLGNGLKSEWLSHDAAVVKAYVDDPQVHDRITPRLARFIVDAGEAVLGHAARWRVPTLLLYAGADRCVAPRGSAAFAAASPRGIVTAQVFAALHHEIFNEPEQVEVFAALTRWLSPPAQRWR